MRGHGGYVGADDIPRLNVLDLQVGRRGGGEFGLQSEAAELAV